MSENMISGDPHDMSGQLYFFVCSVVGRSRSRGPSWRRAGIIALQFERCWVRGYAARVETSTGRVSFWARRIPPWRGRRRLAPSLAAGLNADGGPSGREAFGSLDAQDIAVRLLAERTMLLETHNPLEALRLKDHIYGRPAALETLPVPDLAPRRDVHDPAVLAAQGALLAMLTA